MFDVEIASMDLARFRSVLSPARREAFEQLTLRARELLAGRVVWKVNSTARGGGVAELLESLVAYARGAGVDVLWVVIEGTPDFFADTKRIHNRLHGAVGDGGALDDAARAVYERVLANTLPALSERVHPGDVVIVHPAENAIIVNALQHRATVVAQKSLAEGFGLTVAEAMWKARPIVASRIGGIQSQIIDGETGVLLDDPGDLAAFGRAVTELLAEPQRAARIGERARERARDEFTSPRSLLDYLRVIQHVLERSSVPAAA